MAHVGRGGAGHATHAEGGDPLRGERRAVVAVLFLLAALSWVWLLHQAGRGDAATMGPTMGMAAPLFLLMWTVMMVAMMLPAAAPMVVTFHRVQAGRRQRGSGFVSTWIFVAGYLTVWTMAGVGAFAAAVGAEAIARRTGLASADAARIGGMLIVLAGLYQVTPWKGACLTRCRTPMMFIVTSWRDGNGGAFRMGVAHGAYCLGCCWLLFLILFPLGVMNIAAMAAITVVVTAEKTLPFARGIARIVAMALIAYGIAVLIEPPLLPTFMGEGGSAMPS